jgi:hypothetical protein
MRPHDVGWLVCRGRKKNLHSTFPVPPAEAAARCFCAAKNGRVRSPNAVIRTFRENFNSTCNFLAI